LSAPSCLGACCSFACSCSCGGLACATATSVRALLTTILIETMKAGARLETLSTVSAPSARKHRRVACLSVAPKILAPQRDVQCVSATFTRGVKFSANSSSMPRPFHRSRRNEHQLKLERRRAMAAVRLSSRLQSLRHWKKAKSKAAENLSAMSSVVFIIQMCI
jgi:hypothetical protein